MDSYFESTHMNSWGVSDLSQKDQIFVVIDIDDNQRAKIIDKYDLWVELGSYKVSWVEVFNS